MISKKYFTKKGERLFLKIFLAVENFKRAQP